MERGSTVYVQSLFARSFLRFFPRRLFLFICVHQFGFCGLILHPTCYILRPSLSVVVAPPMIKYANCQPAPACHAHSRPAAHLVGCLPTRQYISSATLLNKFSCTALKTGAPQYAMIFTDVQRVRWVVRGAVGGMQWAAA